ncbi:hypothetical protein FPOAC1_005376 [Fusarium poae]|uniref:hypothetical protein n=1 Tax=Fusarium poae TaxID=36050 RepID=UPI001CE9D739|nr:hypothetical protein FPOAC1_005376 [Fusarium poae]KAG8672115.1 hypothetical protein FPOAC1_005376 [Fusarium poae]
MGRKEETSAWTDSVVSTRKNSEDWQPLSRNSVVPGRLSVKLDTRHASVDHGRHSYSRSITPAVEKGHDPFRDSDDDEIDEQKQHHHDMFDPNRPKMALKDRLHHFTFAWFTLPMSSGGLSLLIFAQPHQFPGLREIGLAVYIINILLVVAICSAMLLRFFFNPGDMSKSITHEREGFFFPTFFLTIATLITSTQRYAIPDNDETLAWAIQVAYWGYVVLTVLLAVGQYSYVFAAHNFGLQTMMPTWILPSK